VKINPSPTTGDGGHAFALAVDRPDAFAGASVESLYSVATGTDNLIAFVDKNRRHMPNA